MILLSSIGAALVIANALPADMYVYIYIDRNTITEAVTTVVSNPASDYRNTTSKLLLKRSSSTQTIA